ncbi:hypothetical protein BYT27DRAFT_7189745 [Phlegmacium glaucopus]|nr:hypothetical protein BYT27DRAFT_7189745 [Phlegmacium glaucopus]
MSGIPPSGSILEPSSSSARTGAQVTLDQEHMETQRSLHEASAALETAYNRIRRVQSLLHLSESLSNADTQRRFDYDMDGLGPGHEALLLSASHSENGRDFGDLLGADFSSLSIEHPNTLSNFESRRPNVAVGPSHAISPANSNQPVFPSGIYPSTTQNMSSFRSFPPDAPNDSRFSQYYGTNEDSASTTRGLRVAAREANARASVTDQMERNMEFLHGVIHGRPPRHPEGSGPPYVANDSPSRLSRNPEYRRTAPLSPILTASSTVNPPSASWRASESRRWRNLRQDARQTARPTSYDRLDAYPSFSNIVNNDFMSQPSSTASHSSLFAADQRNRRFPTVSEQFRLYQEALTTEDNRLTQGNRRFGDIPGNLNADWDADFVSWLLPTPRHDFPQQYRDPLPLPSRYNGQQRDDAIRVTRTSNTAISPPEESLPRRGWARLDPDGNEIPPSEEEELERSRTEYRIRALHRAREHASRSDEANEHLSRMYQPNGIQRVAYGSVMDATLNIQDRRHRQSDIAHRDDQVPFYVDPLPMPLSSMVIKPEKTEQNELFVDIIVPKHACLAGR